MGKNAKPAILVVDDREENLEAFERILRPLEADIVRAASGRAALAATLGRDFAFVLLDLRMPDMDGFEVARILRGDSETRHIPIVFVTADAYLDTQVIEGYGIGAIDFIAKPIDPVILAGKARILLELYRYREDKIGETELHYRALFEGMSEIVIVCEPEPPREGAPEGGRQAPRLRILDANPALERFFRVADRQAKGKLLAEVLPGMDPAFEHDCAHVASGAPPLGRDRLCLAGHLSFRASAYSPSRGYVVLVLSDITGIVEAEEKLAAAQRLAEETLEIKRRFLSNMSHEIRTPLNGIMGMTALLRGSELGEEQRSYLSNLEESSTILYEIVTDILDISRIEAGKWAGREEDFTLQAVCEKALQAQRSAAQAKGIALRVEYRLPATSQAHGDMPAIERILANLVSNAVKFTEHGEVLLSVSAREGRPGLLAFEVRDTGIGISKDKLEHLFGRFVQLDSGYTKRFSGTGLGLALSRELASMLDGRIEVESEEGRGSVFTFILPLALSLPPVAAAPEQASASAEASGGRRSLEGLRVLLVEDNLINALGARIMLERAGCAVSHAKHGDEALDMAGTASFDVILMDVQMPVRDGLSATVELRNREAAAGLPGKEGGNGSSRTRIPIVALTGYAFAQDLERCRDAGMDGFITKPIMEKNLLEITAAAAARAIPEANRFESVLR